MEPIQLGALTVYPFGIFFAVLLVPFFCLAAWEMKKAGLKGETASWFALLALPLCFVLSRLGFCLLNIDMILGYEDPGMILRTGEGGFLLWGAICGMLLAALWTGKITKQSGAKIADSAVIPMCLMIAAIRLLCGLLFEDMGLGCGLRKWFNPDETDFAYRISVWPLEDWSFFERFPFARQNYYGDWCWAVFVPQAIWAGIIALLAGRPKAAPGGKTARFVILFSCGSIVLESMLLGGEIVRLPWLAFVKANQILCAVALVAVILVCVFRLPKGQRLKPAVVTIVQFGAAIGIIIALEFAAFEKKLSVIEWLPADACHLIMAAACVWIAMAVRPVWKRAFSVGSGE